jgi:hypothetical protein
VHAVKIADWQLPADISTGINLFVNHLVLIDVNICVDTLFIAIKSGITGGKRNRSTVAANSCIEPENNERIQPAVAATH